MKPSILLIGAYERDNFGDLLFAKIFDKIFPSYLIIKGGLLGRDLSLLGGDFVVSAKDYLKKPISLPAAVIHGGGETITCLKETAVSMNLPPSIFKEDNGLYPYCESEVSQKLAPSGNPVAYLYNHSDFIQNSKIPFAFISIGGSALYLYANNPEFLSLIASKLKPAKFLSVRDSNTKNYLKKYLNIDAKLYPDLVNLISKTHRDEINQAFKSAQIRKIIGKNYILFQANQLTINKLGLHAIAKQLEIIATNHCMQIVLQPAGLASGHDSLEQLKKIAGIILKKNPQLKIIVQEDRDLWTQVATIANSSCCISTSLHIRVVATSFARPCVSLVSKKVTSYVKTWKFIDNQPYNITLGKLVKAVENAIKTDQQKLKQTSTYMIDKTEESLKDMVATLKLDSDKRSQDAEMPLIPASLFSALSLETDRLREQLVKEILEKRSLELKLNSLISSESWKITSPLRRLGQECRKLIKKY